MTADVHCAVMAVVSTMDNHDVAEYGVRGALSLDVGAEGALADSKALHCLRERAFSSSTRATARARS